MSSRLLLAIVLAALLVRASAWAQSPAAGAKPEARIGVLIGLQTWQDPLQPAASDPGAEKSETVTSETLAPDGSKINHMTETVKADPLQTVWIMVSGGKATSRTVQHILVPRKDGFWRLGMYRDSAEADGGRGDEDLFWVAALGQEPKLALLGSDAVGCASSEANRELDYVGPEYFAYSQFASATCAHYWEGSAYSVRRLDEAAGGPVGLGALLGPLAVQQLRRFNREAKDEPSDCGEPGYEGSDTGWTLKHSEGRWRAVAKFVGTGAGICDRYDFDRRLSVAVPRSLVAANGLPVPWKQVQAAFPGVVDAFVAPRGKFLLIFTRNQILLSKVEAGRPQKPFHAVDIPFSKPVMVEWAVGENAERWEKGVASLPAPDPKARPRAPVP